MGRWRPPSPESSPYITPQGYVALQGELKDLWARRADVVKALSAAAAEGDRSENAEYIYRKKELGGIDARIRYLQKRMPGLNVVRETPAQDRIFFGARSVRFRLATRVFRRHWIFRRNWVSRIIRPLRDEIVSQLVFL